MRKILCITLTFAFMKTIVILPVLAGKEHDAFLSERDQIINSSQSYEEKQNALRTKSETEKKRIQNELDETAKAWLNADSSLNSQFQGYVETALTLKNGQLKTIPFDGAGKTTLQKFADLFQEVPITFNLSVENLAASNNAIDQNFKTTLITELTNKQFSSDANKKLAELWEQYMEAKLSIVLFAGTNDPEKKSDYDLLMAEATAPENTADLITNLLLQKEAEKMMADAVRDLAAKQRAIAQQHELINSIENTTEAFSLRNELFKKQENLNKQALLARDQIARVVGYAGTFLDERIKSILNIEEPLKLLKNKEIVVNLAKELALSPETLAVTGTSNSSKKLSDEEIDKLALELKKGLSQPASVSEEEKESSEEKILKRLFNDLINLRNNVSLSSENYDKTIEFLKRTLKNGENLTTKALRLQVTNAFKGQAFDQFKKNMRGVLTTMAVRNTMNLETLLSNEVFISKMKEISLKIINGTADEGSKSFVAWWNRHAEANFPVYAAQLIEKLSNPDVTNLKGTALENFLAHAGAKELYLQEREKLNQKNQGQNITPYREHIQPYVDTATTPNIAAEAVVTMMAKNIIDGELATEKEKMQSITNEMLKGIQKDTIRQLESLSKELETEEKLVLEFSGVLESLKASILASML